ncbi:MAG: pyridoxal phosphate-dependent aminotransferase [Desulfobacteraceae bacterium]|nr:MAG: pyridoxal phosphate-dependent aminotransferase [Desulfobacteraceae bacterium]
MNRFAAAKMARIHQSGIRRVFEKAHRLEAQGHKVIHFESGRTDFDTPRPIKDAAVRAIEKGLVHYTSSMGIPELRTAVARDFHSRYGIDMDPLSEVLITAGGSGALIDCLMALVETGDEVIVADPMFLFYRDWAEFMGGKTVFMPLEAEKGYRISADALESCVTEKSKVILLNTPHNPTGSCLDRESLEIVAAKARAHDLVVVSDECYDRIVYPPNEHLPIAALPGMRERTLTVNSFSKSFAMDGWRLGWVIGPADLIWELDKAQQHTVINATTFVQYGALAAFDEGDRLIRPMLEEYAARRKLAVSMLRTDPKIHFIEPQGAFYLWLKTGLSMDGWELADMLLEKCHVAVTPGDEFGPSGKGYLRISYSTPRENVGTGLTRIMEMLSSLRRD